MPAVKVENKVYTGNIIRQVNQNVEVEDWNDVLCDLVREDAAFFTISSKAKSHATHSREFNWMEYAGWEPKLTVPSSAAVSLPASGDAAGTCQITFGPGNTKGLVIDTILLCEGTYYRVCNKPSSADGIVCIKELVVPLNDDGVSISEVAPSVTAPATIASKFQGKDFYMLYTSKAEGGDDINPVYRTIEDRKNYVTTFSHDSSISWIKAAELWRPGITQRNWQLGKKAIEHALEIERAFFFGRGYNELNGQAVGGVNRQATKGIVNFHGIQRPPVATYESYTYLDFVNFCEEYVMAYNDKEVITGWCNPAFLTFIIRMLKADTMHTMHLDFAGKQNEYGMNVKRLITPHCDINLIVNKTLRNFYGKRPVLMCLDMDKIRQRYLSANGENFSTKVYKNIQPASSKNYIDNIYTVCGLEVQNAECHSILEVSAPVA